MKLTEVINQLELCPFFIADDSVDVKGVYCGDLLSDVLAHAETDHLWMTIQNHVNIVAVAQLRDVACIVLVNDVAPDPQTIQKAQNLEINICGNSRTSAELCMEIGRKEIIG